MKRGYQYNLSRIHRDKLYDQESRKKKALTIVAVLKEYFSGELSNLSVLDVGSSTGIVDYFLSDFFESVTGIDIDEEAVAFAKKTFNKANLKFQLNDALNMDFPGQYFDVVICTHIYEHVSDASKLLSEIHRVLKLNSVCYFAAGNRLNVFEAHYKLPFLSVIPRPLAHIYIRIMKKAPFYYEKHLSYWGLKKLVSEFDIFDYTIKIIDNPKAFHAGYMVKPGTFTGYIARQIARNAFWLCPSYIWLLRKKNNG